MTDMRPFINATADMLSTMLGVAGELVPQGDVGDVDITGTIQLHGSQAIQLSLCFPHATAAGLVGQMLGLDPGACDEDTLRDGVGEMANIVAGRAKALLGSNKYSLSLPTITVGHGHRVVLFNAQSRLTSVLRTEFGLMAVALSFAESS